MTEDYRITTRSQQWYHRSHSPTWSFVSSLFLSDLYGQRLIDGIDLLKQASLGFTDFLHHSYVFYFTIFHSVLFFSFFVIIVDTQCYITLYYIYIVIQVSKHYVMFAISKATICNHTALLQLSLTVFPILCLLFL